MVRELLDELLTDHTGRAENADVDSCVVHDVLIKKKPAGLLRGRRVLELSAVLAQLRDDRAHPRPADSLRPLSTNRLRHGGHRHEFGQYIGESALASNGADATLLRFYTASEGKLCWDGQP